MISYTRLHTFIAPVLGAFFGHYYSDMPIKTVMFNCFLASVLFVTFDNIKFDYQNKPKSLKFIALFSKVIIFSYLCLFMLTRLNIHIQFFSNLSYFIPGGLVLVMSEILFIIETNIDSQTITIKVPAKVTETNDQNLKDELSVD